MEIRCWSDECVISDSRSMMSGWLSPRVEKYVSAPKTYTVDEGRKK